MKLRHAGNSAISSVPILAEVPEELSASGPELDNGLTELNSDVYSAIRDVKPSRDNHADSRLLSSTIFSFSEISEARSVDGRRKSVVNAEETVEDEL